MTFRAFVPVVVFFVPAYVADLSPLVAARLLPWLECPIDGGKTLGGRPLLGSHKTWRGLGAFVVGGVAAWEAQRVLYQLGLLGDLAIVDYAAQPVVPGALMGLGAGIGDAVKSFFKRRVGIPPGTSWLGFDQLDFFVGALAGAAPVYQPPLEIVLAMLPLVFACDLAVTRLFWRLGWKRDWP